ncbi:hypothetical protein [Peijinzhouia sedimentorum]
MTEFEFWIDFIISTIPLLICLVILLITVNYALLYFSAKGDLEKEKYLHKSTKQREVELRIIAEKRKMYINRLRKEIKTIIGDADYPLYLEKFEDEDYNDF